jgi:hypothetical protein
VKYDLNELSHSDQSRMKKPLEEYEPSSTIQVRFIYLFDRRFSFFLGSRFRWTTGIIIIFTKCCEIIRCNSWRKKFTTINNWNKSLSGCLC